MMARLGVGVLAVVAGFLWAIVPSSPAVGSGAAAASCYDDGAWLIYADGVTVRYADGVTASATREDFTACLYVAARGHRAIAIRGQLVSGGVLLDLGGTSVYWETESITESVLNVTAYDDRVVLRDRCDRAFELSHGTASLIHQGYACPTVGRIRADARTVKPLEFTIFITSRQFVIDAPDGWYHVVLDRTGGGEDPTPRSQITLRSTGAGIWVSTQRDGPDRTAGRIFYIHEPLAGTTGNPQEYRVRDWSYRVHTELIPRAFHTAAYFLFPDREAYWAEARGWLEAMSGDLFHGRAEPVQLEVVSGGGWEVDTETRTIYTSIASTRVILQGYASILANVDEPAGGRYTATLLMLWERYVPGFDAAHALRLAERYAVEVGTPVEVEPVSSRTRDVRALFAKEPPVLASDDAPISADEMLISVVLTVGSTYGYHSGTTVATSETMPNCRVHERYSDGTRSWISHGPGAALTISAGGSWNGVSLMGYSRYEDGEVVETGAYVHGTPTVAGRVRVEVTTRCPGGYSQEPRLVGYSEIIVVDPASAE